MLKIRYVCPDEAETMWNFLPIHATILCFTKGSMFFFNRLFKKHVYPAPDSHAASEQNDIQDGLLESSHFINNEEILSSTQEKQVFFPPLMLNEPEHKTLLENYWYNAFMTLFQDLPQSIATVIILSQGGLQDDPDNPTGVSLPGYLNLIPQVGNTCAGGAAAYEAIRLIHICRDNPTPEKLINAILYTIFSTSTIFNGITNITKVLSNEQSKETDLLSTASTLIALTSTFLILCREEFKLIKRINSKISDDESGHADYKNNAFHLMCSFNLNVSIITSFLATLGIINRNLGAYGYLFGTWFGQVPELIEPTLKKMGCYASV